MVVEDRENKETEIGSGPIIDFPAFVKESGVVRDFVDLRDRFYEPSLRTLSSEYRPGIDRLFGAEPKNHKNSRAKAAQSTSRPPAFYIRNQGPTGRCTGFALAALIDIQRRLQDMPRDGGASRSNDLVSADMLYHMARFLEEFVGRNGTDPRDESAPIVPVSEGVRTLRSVVKAFYHYGVCFDLLPDECPDDVASRWQSSCYVPADQKKQDAFPHPSVEQAKAARRITLGAYFRLKPILNHYHAALNDTGTILASASVHSGWSSQKLAGSGGEISWSETEEYVGAHAFVIVGYTEQGFLVLNSWGADWGGFNGERGVALWTYADWARNIIDGWILRLGVSAPQAFDISIGEQGIGRLDRQLQPGSTPYRELLGHFLHIDDGHYVKLGSYPSAPQIVDTTLKYLDKVLVERVPTDRIEPDANSAPAGGMKTAAIAADRADEKKNYHGILLWVPGSLEGVKATFEQAVQRKKIAKDLGLYPYTLFWCSDFVEDAMETLSQVFRNCAEQAGEDAEHLDQLIEASVRGVGRAFWREVHNSARRAAWGPGFSGIENLGRSVDPGDLGPVFSIVARLFALSRKHNTRIHIVAEGVGALLLDELLKAFDCADIHDKCSEIADIWQEAAQLVSTVNIALPAIDTDTAAEHVMHLVEELNRTRPDSVSSSVPDSPQPIPLRHKSGADQSGRMVPPARIYIPSPDLQRRVCLGDYGKSILHLIANAFEDRRDNNASNEPKTMLGMAEAPAHVSSPHLRKSFSVLSDFSLKPNTVGKLDQQFLTRDRNMSVEIHRTILRHS